MRGIRISSFALASALALGTATFAAESRPAKAARDKTEKAEALIAEYLGPAKLSEKDKQSISRLIGNLGSDDFATRQSASKELPTYGRKALEQLRAALKSPDAEVVERAKQAIAAIEKGGEELRIVTALRETKAVSLKVIDREIKSTKAAAAKLAKEAAELEKAGKGEEARVGLGRSTTLELKAERLADLRKKIAVTDYISEAQSLLERGKAADAEKLLRQFLASKPRNRSELIAAETLLKISVVMRRRDMGPEARKKMLAEVRAMMRKLFPKGR
jgi:hypothetical protein